MFNTRSNDWSFHGISALAWKYYGEDYWAVPKDYSKYPERSVTHPAREPSIRCHQCLVEFNTDSKRRNMNGDWVYAPVTDYICYRRNANAYFCIIPCLDPRIEEEKERLRKLAEAAKYKVAAVPTVKRL